MGDEDDLLKAAQKNDATKLTSILDRHPSLLRMHTPNGTLVLTAMYYDAADVTLKLPSRFANTAVDAAVSGNRAEAVRILLAAGADANTRSEGNATTLHKAAQHGNLEVVRMLLDHGADPNAVRDGGHTPADDAREEGHAAVAELLRARGAKG